VKAVALLAAALAGCALPPTASPPSAQPPPGEGQFVDGNRIDLLVDGPQTHKAMLDAISRARDHVNLESYILEGGEIGERLARLLEKKVREGVKVSVMYDSVGSMRTPKEYFQGLRATGIHVCEFNPISPAKAAIGLNLNNRSHRKLLVVDGQMAFTGGINISSTYSAGSSSVRRPADVKPGEDSARGWRDTHVRVEGPAVERFQRLFLDGWALQDCGPWPEARYYPKLEKKGAKSARVVANDPASGRSEMHAALLSAIGTARERVWLTVGYFVPDPLTRKALTDAAARGVDVRLVLPGFSDFWAPVYAARSHYEELLSAGVRIYEWRMSLMHAKTGVIDSVWASVGSTNIDWRSFVHNYEADLIVRDAAFARQLEERFRRDLEQSAAIDLATWQQRAGGERFKEWLARQWEYLL
jgi:cardiolipin synthase